MDEIYPGYTTLSIIQAILSGVGILLCLLPIIAAFRKDYQPNLLFPIALCYVNLCACIYVFIFNILNARAHYFVPEGGMCRAYGYIGYFLCSLGMMIYVQTAIDRYMVILYGYNIPSMVIRVSILSSTIVAGFLSVLPEIIDPQKISMVVQPSHSYCTLAFTMSNYMPVRLVFFLTLLIITSSLLIIVYCYFQIYTKFKKTVKLIVKVISLAKRERNLVYCCVINCLSFVGCWTPFLLKVFIFNSDTL